MLIALLPLCRRWTSSISSSHIGKAHYWSVHLIWVEVNWRRTLLKPPNRCRIHEKEMYTEGDFQNNMKIPLEAVHFSRWGLSHFIKSRCDIKSCSNHLQERSYWTCAACARIANNSVKRGASQRSSRSQYLERNSIVLEASISDSYY